ncbi:MAG: glycosyltransferase family 4 protein [Epsilonproteobacteria bacterium]|nr:glycosyltransferase family 4 protein [Campylobacterota bacterium]
MRTGSQLVKPKVALLTLKNSYVYGGVLSLVKTAYQFCENYFEPTVFCLGFDQEISTSLRRLKFSSSTRRTRYFDMNCIEVGARWAFWEPGHYAYTRPYWHELLNDYEYCFAISGTAIAGHPFLQLDKKYLLWLATPYDHDRFARVAAMKGVRKLIDSLAHKKMLGIERNVLESASFTLATSEYAKNAFHHLAARHRGAIARCGYPIKQNSFFVYKEKTFQGNVLLAVGRFSDPRKNITMLLTAFENIYTKMPDAVLYVVGDRPAEDVLRPFKNFSSFKHVHFTGRVSDQERNQLYEKASVLLITSHQEGLGIVGLEALSHGIPVVSTDCGGTRDFVHDDQTGYLVAVNDVQAMSDSVITVLSNQALYTKLSLNGQMLVRSEFSYSMVHAIMKEAFVQTYPELEQWFAFCDGGVDALEKVMRYEQRHNTL